MKKFRFSFKALLFLLLVIALFLTSYVLPETSRRTATNVIEQLGGYYRYEGFDVEEYKWKHVAVQDADSEKPGFWKKVFGTDAGRKIQWIGIEKPRKDFNDRSAHPLPEEVGSAQIEKLLAQTRALDRLDTLELMTGHQISSRAIELMGKLNQLRFVTLYNAEIDGRSVQAISQLENLEVIVLQSGSYHTEDFSALADLDHLAWVRVIQDPGTVDGISEAGLKSLRSSAASAYVTFHETAEYRYDRQRERNEQRRIERERKNAEMEAKED